MSKKYWLVKSEPEVFSIINLQNQKDQTTYWDGVRNYQARNYLRDEMKMGDSVLFYHSNAEPLAIVGVCDVVKEGYPDFTAFDPKNNHFDPKSKKENPAWYMVDLKLNEIFKNPVTLEQIKSNKKLQDMKLIQRGNRLSVMPITKDEFNEIIRMSK
ncbi:MAG: EVE domain-containing protein [Ignavibacteriaceae bacterium]|nr:EVE domain-containing protein [Ignavibacteriaceae bacterium]